MVRFCWRSPGNHRVGVYELPFNLTIPVLHDAVYFAIAAFLFVSSFVLALASIVRPLRRWVLCTIRPLLTVLGVLSYGSHSSQVGQNQPLNCLPTSGGQEFCSWEVSCFSSSSDIGYRGRRTNPGLTESDPSGVARGTFMPNGGEHYERLGACPLCGSPSIRIRRQRHRRLLWRCRRCNRVFGTPKVAEYVIPPGDDGSGYVFAESIPQMERRARRPERQGGQRGRRRSVSRILTAVIILVIILGAAGLFIYMAGLVGGGNGSARVPKSERPLVVAITPSSTPKATPTAASAPTSTSKVAQASVPTAIPTKYTHCNTDRASISYTQNCPDHNHHAYPRFDIGTNKHGYGYSNRYASCNANTNPYTES